MKLDAPLSFLGGLSARRFVNEYWQKKPLFVPRAFPEFKDLVDFDGLCRYAQRADVISRRVSRSGDEDWSLEHGPFTRRDLIKPLSPHWSLLVQNLNHLQPEADAFLQQFSFIPYARLDDLMVSWAPDGGGVGPHYDSYDVFLIQGGGSKTWRIARDYDESLLPDAPLRILAAPAFEAEYRVETGDLLYLPPRYAHHGIQHGEGTTYSVGFRVPSRQELASQFLMFMAERIQFEGLYEDPDLEPQDDPGRLSNAMLRKCHALLSEVRWDESVVADFLGSYLSQPKQHVWFEPSGRPLSAPSFAKRVAERGLELDPRSMCLYHGHALFLNGEEATVSLAQHPELRELADRRRLSPRLWPEPVLDWLYEVYCDGFLRTV